MAQSLTTTLTISITDTTYTAHGEGAAVLQFSDVETLGVGLQALGAQRGARVTLDVNASAVAMFPTTMTLPANARITAYFVVEYGAGDTTAVNRLLTWARDSAAVETNTELCGGFSFDTSLTVSRVGTATCYVTPFYIVHP